MIEITPDISLSESEVAVSFVRSAGPGGQNVNKVATAVQLRFDVAQSPSLPEAVRERLRKLAGRRLTAEGVLVIEARRYRTQAQNRADALQRLVALIRRATEAPKPRRPTRRTATSQEARLAAKRHRSEIKQNRRLRDG